MTWFKKTKKPTAGAVLCQTAASRRNGLSPLETESFGQMGLSLYEGLRENIPIIDAAVTKLIRLLGTFRVESGHTQTDRQMAEFLRYLRVGYNGIGIQRFIEGYLDDLLTYGNAVGEMVLTRDRKNIAALVNAPLRNMKIEKDEKRLQPVYLVQRDASGYERVRYPQYILFSALNPDSGKLLGNSLLKGLPFVSSILMQIYHCVDKNFERLGDLRFAVTYKPNGSAVDQAYARQIASNMANQWSDVMNSAKYGQVKDFVAVGDVDIRVIGSDVRMIDIDVPLRHICEQIISKTGIPPFMLGINWSTTERMSQQQADILTSELDSYRSLLDPVILQVCNLWMRLHGHTGRLSVKWNTVKLADEVELARARLLNAQAEQLERTFLEGGDSIDPDDRQGARRNEDNARGAAEREPLYPS
ncbi:hypothetical protein [Candidatus Soleaferrea massiliensis]|uniref:hypothetical protein n=1 Tax=Candidatus Soleaferrea massiliensis TaxID=1470354 RepID=UPI0005911D4C|nr:hypothetical protein [Candidatus Soleaferrea massiliensis]